MRRARLIYNPSAGREAVERKLSAILNKLEECGLQTSCHATTGRWDAAEAAKQAGENGYDVVIAAGGDGTIHEVINGLSVLDQRPQLGIIPGGTSNDFARALGLPRDLLQATEVLGKGSGKKVDIGKVNGRYFLNVAAAGSLTEITYEVPSRLKTVLGQAAYYAKGLERLSKLVEPFPVELKTASHSYEEELILLIVANSPAIGGFPRLAPQATMTDGKLDVLGVRKCGLPDLIHLISLLLKGEHPQDSHVLYFQTDRVEVHSSSEMQLNVDGEWGGTVSGTFEVFPHHLELIC
ncbi:YegS/Rv2252/BmrU family lipid kinase [Mechercharimyces sp. CAU 1602]|uniref:YegS/Rv2252/BmrU family lipid kinase n=1 Tax=Mechercharimyces sp. CAU 1602 TaxID=2973933 RepID=UPI002162850F|nr:YegS/Rv2252/BmrU family lipid kinase [Mechercharimyces sp. CAU 1602]MCS1352043.1 YegS/Rv2252/BmrU family lipid kinase [Mechercharimyces sp. CAU 1602]